jgi:hypothetical protein
MAKKRGRLRMDIIASRLAWLKQKHNGDLTPRAVVADAQRKDSPLHRSGGFCWDVNKAAYRHWLDHARGLIASVELVIHTDHRVITVPYYVHRPGNVSGYWTVRDLQADRSAAVTTIDAELITALGVLHRLRNLSIALGLESRIAKAIENLCYVREHIKRVPRKRQTARTSRRNQQSGRGR